jgi:hypothetical protein
MSRLVFTRLMIICVSIALPATVSRAQTQGPEQVRPPTGTFEELRKASTDIAQTVGEHLDAGHDWLSRKMEHWLENLDIRFVGPEEERIVVPLSPLRIGLDTEFLHRRDGIALLATPNFEAWLRLPNIERRLKVFIRSTDVAESPADPTLEHNPVQLGMQFAPLSHVNFEFGAQAKLWPSVFAALRWAPAVDAGDLKVYPFAKAYVQSGLGPGVSGGVTLEHWSGRWIMRSASYANWVRNTTYTDWTQTFIVGYVPAVIHQGRYGSVADGRDLACGVALRLSVSGDRASRTSLYEESVILKRPLHGGWLFGYVEPIVRWDRNYDWHPDALIPAPHRTAVHHCELHNAVGLNVYVPIVVYADRSWTVDTY